MKKSHFIFDLDDTLTNAYEHNQQLFLDTFRLYVPEIDEHYVRDYHFHNRGRALTPQFQEVIEHLQLALDADELVRINEEMHTKFAHQIEVFNETVEFLQALKQNGKKLSLITNRQNGSLGIILKKNKLDNIFENILSCADLGHEKPDPFVLLKIISSYTEPKDAYIYFGDSATDSDFAHNAGIDAIIVDNYINRKNFYRNLRQAFL